jgi:serine/threonine protein phosphatase PrpC
MRINRMLQYNNEIFGKGSKLQTASITFSINSQFTKTRSLSLDSERFLVSRYSSQSEHFNLVQPFNFNIVLGVAGESKGNLVMGKPPSTTDFGEDAYFSSGTPRYSCFGVADGVGGWNTLGVNPALFSNELMQNSRIASESLVEPFPWNIMEEAYTMTKEGGNVVAGSSTACILTFDKSNATLHSANIGDSGFLLFRLTDGEEEKKKPNTNKNDNNEDSEGGGVSDLPDYQLIHEARENQHYFNAPFQLAIIPDTIPEEQRKYFMADSPSDALRDSFGPLMHGDVLVVATDGLFDNVFIEEIGNLINERFRYLFGANGKLDNEELAEVVQSTCELLVKDAAYYSLSPRTSPFGKVAANYGLDDHYGGKVDDITILIGVVTAAKKPLAIPLL